MPPLPNPPEKEEKNKKEQYAGILCRVLAQGSTCQAIFEEFLALEYTDPAYGQVHFLTVACFMIQHGRYSDEALIGMQSLLKAYFDEQLNNQQLRQRTAQVMGDTSCAWKVTRRAGDRPLPRVAWSMTIVDVARGKQDPEQYCAYMKQWAQTILQEMPALLH